MTKRSKKGEPKRPRGRPTLYTAELAERVCAGLAAGQSLRRICEPEDMPDERTVRRWAKGNVDGFSPQYAQAREDQAHAFVDQLIDIADNDTGDPQRDRLRLDARKWIVSKLLPKVYGEKVDVEHSGKVTLESLIADVRTAERAGG